MKQLLQYNTVNDTLRMYKNDDIRMYISIMCLKGKNMKEEVQYRIDNALELDDLLSLTHGSQVAR